MLVVDAANQAGIDAEQVTQPLPEGYMSWISACVKGRPRRARALNGTTVTSSQVRVSSS
jgi:hypothetical protein